MATLEKMRLFKVSSENVIYTGIEAETAQEAIAKSNAKKNNLAITQVTSEPIYQAGLGLETEEDSENSVFELTIRGTNEESVKKLRDAIARAIGGPAVEWYVNDTGDSDNGAALQRFIGKTGLWISAM